MPKPIFLEKIQIIRNAIQPDLFQFGLPALLIYTAAQAASAAPTPLSSSPGISGS